MTAFLIALAFLLNRRFGAPHSWMEGFEDLAARVEALLFAESRLRGALAVVAVLLPPVLVADEIALALEELPVYWGAAWSLLVLYFTLDNHGTAVDPTPRTPPDPAAACIQALENGGRFGVFFWFLVAGAPGALLYRLAHNLKRQWDRETSRHREFGWAAAELDDILGLAPAYFCAVSYALLGRTRQAYTCWRQQARGCVDANTGIVLATAGGALGLRLREDPLLGSGTPPAEADIARARALAQRGVLLWLALMALGSLAWWLLERHAPEYTQHWHDLLASLRETLVD